MTIDALRPAALLDANGNATLELAELGPALARAIDTTTPVSADQLDNRIQSAWSRAAQSERAAVRAAKDSLEKNLATQKSANKSLDVLAKIVQGGITASIVGIFVGLLAGTAGIFVVCAGLAAMLVGALLGGAQQAALDREKSAEPEARRALQAALADLVTEARQARTTAHVQL